MKKFILFIVTALLGLFLYSTCLVEAKPKKEVQTTVIPSTVKVYEGTTKNGNPKYWIEVSGVKVTISKSNADKLKQGQPVLLVKWVDENGKYSYSTRYGGQGRGKSTTPNLDLTSIKW